MFYRQIPFKKSDFKLGFGFPVMQQAESERGPTFCAFRAGRFSMSGQCASVLGFVMASILAFFFLTSLLEYNCFTMVC